MTADPRPASSRPRRIRQGPGTIPIVVGIGVIAASGGLAVWVSGDSGPPAGLLPTHPAAAFAAAAPAAPAVPAVSAIVRLSPERPPEGTLFTIVVEGGDPAAVGAGGSFEGQPLHFATQADGSLVAVAAAPLDSIGIRPLRLEIGHADGSRDARLLDVQVQRGSYAMQRLSVAPQFGQPQPPEIQRRIESETARAFDVSRRSHETPRMWEPPFVAPRESRITSGFGHGRTFNGQVQSRHTGTDYAGAVGAPIVAPARGIVALVDDFYLGGGVVYIDHGAGLVTGYLHLSEKLVAEGDVVEPGQVIARVGATGRVTGPHLHWVVRYGPHSVDGSSLLTLNGL
jgi:murein DD-endopeptidase MepM/ murein hydrolase activator NlpD